MTAPPSRAAGQRPEAWKREFYIDLRAGERPDVLVSRGRRPGGVLWIAQRHLELFDRRWRSNDLQFLSTACRHRRHPWRK